MIETIFPDLAGVDLLSIEFKIKTLEKRAIKLKTADGKPRINTDGQPLMSDPLQFYQIVAAHRRLVVHEGQPELETAMAIRDQITELKSQDNDAQPVEAVSTPTDADNTDNDEEPADDE